MFSVCLMGLIWLSYSGSEVFKCKLTRLQLFRILLKAEKSITIVFAQKPLKGKSEGSSGKFLLVSLIHFMVCWLNKDHKDLSSNRLMHHGGKTLSFSFKKTAQHFLLATVQMFIKPHRLLFQPLPSSPQHIQASWCKIDRI